MLRSERARVGVVAAQGHAAVLAEEVERESFRLRFALQTDNKGSLAAAERVFSLVCVLVAGGECRREQDTYNHIAVISYCLHLLASFPCLPKRQPSFRPLSQM